MITVLFTTALTVAALLLFVIHAAASLLEEEAMHGFYEECAETVRRPRLRSACWNFKPRGVSAPAPTNPTQHLELK